MPTGTVKWFGGAKGYGFIQPDQGNKDIFVHISAVEQAGLRGLKEGQKVEYQEPKKPTVAPPHPKTLHLRRADHARAQTLFPPA